jgi:glycosyltransferase involved in cell wall biosynthesis
VLGGRQLGAPTLRALRRAARPVDVVVAYGSTTLPACAAALSGTSTPFVYRSIGDPSSWVRSAWHRRLTGLQFRRANQVVALWDGAAKSIEELYGVGADRITVIPNARNGAFWTPPSPGQRRTARAAVGLGDDAAVIAFVGTLSPEKQVDLAIAAVARSPEGVLLIVGDGPCRDASVEHAARIAPGRIRFLGSREDVRSILYAADALLITSATEGMPGVALEALMCGLPVVATSVGALGDLPGVVTAPAEPAALAAALSNRPAPLVSADARLAQFTWTSVVPRWHRLLGAVARQGSDGESRWGSRRHPAHRASSANT